MKTKILLLITIITFGISCSRLPKKDQPVKKESILSIEENKNPFDIPDPWEGFNRRSYYVNAKLDKYVFLPVVSGYEKVTPNFLEDRVSNFFSNLRETTTFVNALLQGEVDKAATTLSRFTVNSTWGLLGLFDVATKWNIQKQKEDFGLTLATYGVKPGPYLVLPIFGPSSLRDATGLVVDSASRRYYDPLELDDKSINDLDFTIPNAIDTRKRTNFKYNQTGSPFEYELVRYFYLKSRMLQSGKVEENN